MLPTTSITSAKLFFFSDEFAAAAAPSAKLPDEVLTIKKSKFKILYLVVYYYTLYKHLTQSLELFKNLIRKE